MAPFLERVVITVVIGILAKREMFTVEGGRNPMELL